MAIAKAQWNRPRPGRVRTIRERLRTVYGTPRMEPHGDPLGELVLTVLSQSTNDRNRDVAFDRLREMATGRPFAGAREGASIRGPKAPENVPRASLSGECPGSTGYMWRAVLAAPVSEIEAAIRPGGISKVKSARIKAILETIEERQEGSLDLSWMREAPVETSRNFLCALPGVGRKTAACVLLFSYGLHDIPVDTHVSRVGWRLGLFRPGASFDELHDELLQITPRGAALELHVNMLRHGRRTCLSQRPRCSECALVRICPSAAMFLSG